jgi:hypothetical protein
MKRNTFANGTRRGVMESPFGSRDWPKVRVRRLTLQLRACCATERALAGLSNVDMDLLKFTRTCGGSPGQTQDRRVAKPDDSCASVGVVRVLLACIHRVTSEIPQGFGDGDRLKRPCFLCGTPRSRSICSDGVSVTIACMFL